MTEEQYKIHGLAVPLMLLSFFFDFIPLLFSVTSAATFMLTTLGATVGGWFTLIPGVGWVLGVIAAATAGLGLASSWFFWLLAILISVMGGFAHIFAFKNCGISYFGKLKWRLLMGVLGLETILPFIPSYSVLTVYSLWRAHKAAREESQEYNEEQERMLENNDGAPIPQGEYA